MKIFEPARTNIQEARPTMYKRSSPNSISFQNIVSSLSKEYTKDHLQKLLKDIDQQGQQLCENPTFKELKKYKDLIQRYIGDVVKQGMGLYQSESWDLYGGNKSLKTIEVLDKRLIELTDHVLNQQNDSLSILERIGEIKGLLLNLYT